MDAVTPFNSAHYQSSHQVLSNGLGELEALLGCYRAVADPLSYLTARRTVDEIRLEVAGVTEANLNTYNERVDRLCDALTRAVCEWIMEREA